MSPIQLTAGLLLLTMCASQAFSQPPPAGCQNRMEQCNSAMMGKMGSLTSVDQMCGITNEFLTCVYRSNCPLPPEMMHSLRQSTESAMRSSGVRCELVAPPRNLTEPGRPVFRNASRPSYRTYTSTSRPSFRNYTSPPMNWTSPSGPTFPVNGGIPPQALAFINPFMKMVNSTSRLNEAQIILAKEQTSVAKLLRKKLNLEIRRLKKEKYAGRPKKG